MPGSPVVKIKIRAPVSIAHLPVVFHPSFYFRSPTPPSKHFRRQRACSRLHTLAGLYFGARMCRPSNRHLRYHSIFCVLSGGSVSHTGSAMPLATAAAPYSAKCSERAVAKDGGRLAATGNTRRFSAAVHVPSPSSTTTSAVVSNPIPVPKSASRTRTPFPGSEAASEA
jgi:hypothetical protein